MVTPRDRLSVETDRETDWYGSPEGEAYFSRDIPQPAEPRTWTPYPKKGRTVGFKPKRKIYKLAFADPEMEGLVVRARSTSVEQFLEIQSMAASADEGAAVESLKTMFATFVSVLIDWNLEAEDSDEILPLEAKSLLIQDFDFAMTLVMAWIEAVAGVPDAVGKASTNGSPLLEGSLQMEPLSVSLAS